MLKMFVRMIRPMQVLEIGTYSGYSALCMAEGLPEGAQLHTIEINDEQEEFTRPWLERSPYADKIKFYIGDALELVPQMSQQFDLAFTIEINDEQEEFTRPWLERSPYADKIKFYIGDALELVPQMSQQFDLAFIDGDKRKYLDYYELILPRLSPGGYIIADNTLWDGHVLEEHPHASDLQTIRIKAFNDFVAADQRVEKVILPLRDGLTIIRKKN